MGANALRSRGLAERQIGTFVAVSDIALAEAMGSVFDVLVIDLEHGSLDTGQAQALTLAIQARRSAALVRMASADDPRVAAVLDSGADGVVAPMIESTDQAAMFAEKTRYPPAGRRGFGPRRSGDFGRETALHEARPLCAVQIETGAGVKAAAAIAAVDGVDMVILGCSDLALALGTPGEFEHPAIRDAIISVAAAAQESDRTFALAAGGQIGRLPVVAPVAVDLLLHGVDLRLYVQAAESAAEALREVATQLGAGAASENATQSKGVRSSA